MITVGQMSMDRQIRLLSFVEVLEPLSEEELEELAYRTPDVHLDQGEVFTPPERREQLYMLKEGRVQVCETTPEGEELTLSVVEAGDLFGEMALTGQRLSGTYVRALEPSLVCTIRRQDLEEVVLRKPEVGLRLVRLLSRRLREIEARLADITTKDVPTRLASLILRLIDSEGVMTEEGIRISTRYTHEQLATMIGTKRVPVSRAFKKLKEGGIVEIKERRIHIKDLEGLKRAAKMQARERTTTI